MLQIILLIFGIVYALRKPKLKRLNPSDFPQVPESVFHEWKALETSSINWFLWASWGVFLVSILVGIVVGMTDPDSVMKAQVLMLIVFVVMLVLSAIPGSKAAKLKKAHGIAWPK